MTAPRDFDPFGTPQGTSPHALKIGLVRTLVLQLGSESVAEGIRVLAARRGHEARRTDSPEECYWLVTTGAIDFLVLAVAGRQLSAAAQLIERLREDPAADPLHFLLVLEEDAEVTDDLVRAGVDDYLSWPGDTQVMEMRLALAEQCLTRRESAHRTAQDLRRKAKNFETVFNASPFAILIITSSDGRILEANRTVESVLGYSGAALRGKYMAALFPDLFQNVSVPVGELEWVRGIAPREASYRHPHNGMRHMELMAMPITWNESGQLLVKIGDVNIRREIDNDRISASKAESIRLLAGGVAHDFNNILTAIAGNIGLLSEHSYLTPDNVQLLNRAEAACERARGLAEQLATFARQGELATGLRNLGPLLRRSVQFALYGGKIQPSFSIPENLWPVYCDESQVSQVVANLTINADQSMEDIKSSGRLHISCTNLCIPEGTRLPLAPGDYVRVSFKDDGPGIPAQDILRIFDPYFSTRSGLSGLGLATAATIIKNHRGYLRAESVEGEGALFEIYLPALSDPTMLAVGDEDEDGGEGLASGSDGPGTRVLFMDDEEDIRDIVDRILKRYGFEVYCAADGREAIEVYEKAMEFGEPFDVLLFDLDVRGGLGGREAIQHLRKKHPHLKALVTSGYSDDRILENHREAGFSGVLTKPFRIDRLVATVTQLAQSST